jgi:potassium-transporting ATPase KdpC subunit
MINQLRPALALIGIFTLLTGLALPLGFVGFGALIFPDQARGSLVIRDGRVVGSSLIGQDFTTARYFHPRPSATTVTDPNDATKTLPAPYAADASAGSNLAPTSASLVARVAASVSAWRAEGGPAPMPVDAATTSGSGLDPDISPANAFGQVARVAAARGVSAESLRAEVAAHISRPLLGFIGEAHVNVLALNLALDRVDAR